MFPSRQAVKETYVEEVPAMFVYQIIGPKDIFYQSHVVTSNDFYYIIRTPDDTR